MLVIPEMVDSKGSEIYVKISQNVTLWEILDAPLDHVAIHLHVLSFKADINIIC